MQILIQIDVFASDLLRMEKSTALFFQPYKT